MPTNNVKIKDLFNLIMLNFMVNNNYYVCLYGLCLFFVGTTLIVMCLSEIENSQNYSNMTILDLEILYQ